MAKAQDTTAGVGEQHRNLLALTGMRLLVGTALLAATAYVTLGKGETFDRRVEGLLYAIVASIYLGSLISGFLLRTGRWLSFAAAAQITGDILAASGLVYLTGGAESIFTILYPLAIVNAAIGLSRRGAVTSAAASSATFVLLAVAVERGWIAPPGGLERAPMPLGNLLLTLGANVSAFLLTAALSAHLAEQLQGARHQLARAETELTALSALHEGIVRSVPTGILTVDGEQRITFLNPSGEEITGWRMRDVLGQPLEATAPDIARVLRVSLPRRDEAVIRRPDGTQRTVGYSLAPLVAAGTPAAPGYVIVFQDLTELRRMEETVRRADRLAAVGKLAAGLAHEIRNPLTSMCGSIELLGASRSLDATGKRLLGIVLREAERLEALVRDFLSYARPAPPVLLPVDVAELVTEVVVLFRPTAEGRGLRVGTELVARPRIHADAGQLRQLLWNLLGNAADATPAGGSVTVRVSARQGAAIVEVVDSGVGIAREDLGRIFDPFFTTKERGTGLGLALVVAIAAAHGGLVEVESERGKGSRFRVSLPEQPAAALATPHLAATA